MSLPPSSAGPIQVREYLAHTLIAKHDVAPEEAQKIANNWQIGRREIFEELLALNGLLKFSRNCLGMVLVYIYSGRSKRTWTPSGLNLLRVG